MSNSIALDAFPTKYWHKLDDGRIQCDVCPRACKMHEGQQGLCFVSECRNDEIVLATYGRTSGFCIDPIEKKPINHKEGQSTHCHACHQVLIGRDWYELSEWNLTSEGRCNKCGVACGGVFDAQPGRWGAKRVPVRMSAYSVV